MVAESHTAPERRRRAGERAREKTCDRWQSRRPISLPVPEAEQTSTSAPRRCGRAGPSKTRARPLAGASASHLDIGAHLGVGLLDGGAAGRVQNAQGRGAHLPGRAARGLRGAGGADTRSRAGRGGGGEAARSPGRERGAGGRGPSSGRAKERPGGGPGLEPNRKSEAFAGTARAHWPGGWFPRACHARRAIADRAGREQGARGAARRVAGPGAAARQLARGAEAIAPDAGKLRRPLARAGRARARPSCGRKHSPGRPWRTRGTAS